MLESAPVAILVAIILGFLSGLGVGGGSLLMVWFTAVLDWEIQDARAVNLLFFLPAALIACIIRHRQGTLKWKPLLPAIVPGCLLAALASLFAKYTDTALLKKLFGILLIIAGIRELFYRERNAR